MRNGNIQFITDEVPDFRRADSVELFTYCANL